ncbi:MAG: hypothetical protein KDE55_06395 [Novosphingobium sp.]|nr:hypothetical protein [Novosphingobium sp.]
MGKYILAVPSSAKEGRDDDYNEWYNSQHIHDICAIPGVKSGRRFVPSAASPMPAPANYFALYEIDTDDIGAVMGEMFRRSEGGEMPMTDALDMESARMWVFEQTLETESA